MVHRSEINGQNKLGHGIHDFDPTMWRWSSVEVKSHLDESNPSLLKHGLKERIKKGVLESEDVLFYWSIVSANWTEKHSAEILIVPNCRESEVYPSKGALICFFVHRSV